MAVRGRGRGDGCDWKCFGVSSEQHWDFTTKTAASNKLDLMSVKLRQRRLYCWITGSLAGSQNLLWIDILKIAPFRASPDLMNL